ncbi:MAG: hypothetical protein KKE11_03225 [Gammaproteobacteria bacterium]|nr:hypothetical protein [Gammaproteobacteria bacterium]
MKRFKSLDHNEILFVVGGSSAQECLPGCILNECTCSDLVQDKTGIKIGLGAVGVGCIGLITSFVLCCIGHITSKKNKSGKYYLLK